MLGCVCKDVIVRHLFRPMVFCIERAEHAEFCTAAPRLNKPIKELDCKHDLLTNRFMKAPPVTYFVFCP